VFLYRSVAKTSERVGVLGDDTTGMLGSALSGSAPARSLSLATDLYKNTIVLLFLVRYLRLGTRLIIACVFFT
jgi:hypothetical protein